MSEMHETFAFWSFNEWKSHMEKEGFEINPESMAFSNPWIVENRFKGKLELYKFNNDRLELVDYPVTNMFLIAERKF